MEREYYFAVGQIGKNAADKRRRDISVTILVQEEQGCTFARCVARYMGHSRRCRRCKIVAHQVNGSVDFRSVSVKTYCTSSMRGLARPWLTRIWAARTASRIRKGEPSAS